MAMRIYSLIYTKVPPEDSPWGKQGFHMVFYPASLMTKKEVTEIENKIYSPGAGKFKKKKIVFYQRIGDICYLVILHLRDLSNAGGEAGDKGIFLCQGFLFPPELWTKTPTPLVLFDWVRNSLFKNHEEIFSSSRIDRDTGNMEPLEIPTEKLTKSDAFLPQLTSDFERKLMLLLNKLARNREKAFPVVLRGTPDKVSALMNKLLAYVPNALKVKLGWDSAFDGGNLGFCPLKVVGFHHTPPRGDAPLKVDIETSAIDPIPAKSRCFIPESPYEKWVDHCTLDAITQARIEKAYALSSLLTDGHPLPDEEVLERIACFTSVNKRDIEASFLRRCEEYFDLSLARYVSDGFSPESKLELLIRDMPLESFIGPVGAAIVEKEITPQTTKFFPAEDFLTRGSETLTVIGKLRSGEPLSSDDLKPLKESEKLELLKYLVLTKWMEKEGVREIPENHKTLFSEVFSTDETEQNGEPFWSEAMFDEMEFEKVEKFEDFKLLNEERDKSEESYKVRMMRKIIKLLKL